MIKCNKRVVLAHPARQHSFQLARALEMAGLSYEYITTVYLKKGNLTDVITNKFLKGSLKSRATGRRCNEVPDENIIQYLESLGLILLFLQRIKSARWLYKFVTNLVNYLFSRKLVSYVIKSDAQYLILFDQYAHHVLKMLKKKGHKITVILDMSAPNYTFMLEQYKKNISEYKFTTEQCKKSKIADFEIRTADYFLVASDFTKISLGEISPSKIFKCRYGIDEELILPYENIQINCKTNTLFIGRLTNEKGFDNFVKLASCNRAKSKFIALGDLNSCDPEIIKDNEKKIEFLGHVPKSTVNTYLDTSKVLIMPSLADGFGFVVLEALARGVIVICSDNTGASDLIIHGKNGFIYSTSDYKALSNLYNDIMSNKFNLEDISYNAAKTAKECSWKAYNECISSSMNSLLKE